MDISLSFTATTKRLAYSIINSQIELSFDKAEIKINKQLSENQIDAEILLHEINEVEIARTILKTAKNAIIDEKLTSLIHNLNAESLNEFETENALKNIFVYRKSDKLANIDGKDHKKQLTQCREAVYGKEA